MDHIPLGIDPFLSEPEAPETNYDRSEGEEESDREETTRHGDGQNLGKENGVTVDSLGTENGVTLDSAFLCQQLINACVVKKRDEASLCME